MGSIWYLSKKELASFFLISIAEHVIVIIVFAVLIYGEPADIAAETSENSVIVTIEEIKQQEPILAEIVPRERTRLEKPPALPKIEIRNVTTTDPGVVIESSVPKLPKTHAQVVDTGVDTVLRSPGPKEREQRYQDAVPKLGVESIPDSSRKPILEVGPSEREKEGPRATIARTPGYIRDSVSSRDERLGPSSEVARPSFVGDITGDIAGRRVILWPKPPAGFSGTEGGSVTIKFWVDPAGNVTRVKISKKSGNPRLDKIAAAYVEQIHFEELPRNFQQKVQSGEISIDFELIRGTG